MSNFNFDEAQRYELEWQRNYLTTAFMPEYVEWQERKKTLPHGYYYKHFFPSAYSSMADQFLDYVKDKKCLEIGCGTIPLIKEAWNINERIVIDPLALKYHEMEMEMFSKSFFDGITIIPERADNYHDGAGVINGFILCRNALDHMEDPLSALWIMCLLAGTGCYLLIWSDIWHLDGGNEGHRNISKNPFVFDSFLTGMGFQRICNAPKVRDNPVYIEFGGVYRKR